MDQTVRQLTAELAACAPKVRPKGMGALTHEAVASEVADWHRFKSWRQVGSYAGLTHPPSEKRSSRKELCRLQWSAVTASP